MSTGNIIFFQDCKIKYLSFAGRIKKTPNDIALPLGEEPVLSLSKDWSEGEGKLNATAADAARCVE